MDPPGPPDAPAPDYRDDRGWVRLVQSADADPARLFPCEFPSRDKVPAKQPQGRARSERPWRDSFEWRTARQQSQEPPPFLYATAVPGAGTRGFYGAAHMKFAWSSVLPVPLYFATCGYGHKGRVIGVKPPLPGLRDATIRAGAVPASRQRSSAPRKSA